MSSVQSRYISAVVVVNECGVRDFCKAIVEDSCRVVLKESVYYIGPILVISIRIAHSRWSSTMVTRDAISISQKLAVGISSYRPRFFIEYCSS